MLKTKWLLPVLLIGLCILFIKLPTSTPDPALADGRLTADELQDIGPQADLPTVKALINKPVLQNDETADQAAQIDDDTHGTY
jgi:hypothetical protein